jgi:hypothetical protein
VLRMGERGHCCGDGVARRTATRIPLSDGQHSACWSCAAGHIGLARLLHLN